MNQPVLTDLFVVEVEQMVCDKCGIDKPDALQRLAPQGMKEHWHGDPDLKLDPVLCATCCSRAPGREWMLALPWVEQGQ